MVEHPIDNKRDYDQYYSKVSWDKRDSLASRYILYLSRLLLEKIDCAEIKKVVDVGCGDGAKTFNLLQLFKNANILGVDFSAPGIEHANRLYKKLSSRIRFEVYEAENIAYLNNDVDLVTAFYVLEHIKDWKSVVDSWFLSGVRYVLLFVPSGRMYRYDKIEHYQHFPKGTLEKYFSSCGYDCINSFYWGFPFYHPITKIALDIGMNSARETTSQKPTFFLNLIYDVLYFLYTRCTSRRIGGDFIGLFQRENDINYRSNL